MCSIEHFQVEENEKMGYNTRIIILLTCDRCRATKEDDQFDDSANEQTARDAAKEFYSINTYRRGHWSWSEYDRILCGDCHEQMIKECEHVIGEGTTFIANTDDDKIFIQVSCEKCRAIGDHTFDRWEWGSD
jgi:hypothetical protein